MAITSDDHCAVDDSIDDPSISVDDCLSDPTMDDSILSDPTVDGSINEPTVDDSVSETAVDDSINEPTVDDSIVDKPDTAVNALNPAVGSGDFKKVVELMQQRALSNDEKILSAYQPFLS